MSLQRATIPYWLFFNVESAAEDLWNLIKSSEEFEEIYMMILSHGKESIGYTPASHWKTIMKKAIIKNAFIGSNPAKYPVDFAFYSRYNKKLEKVIQGRFYFQESMGIEYGLRLMRHYSQGATKFAPL